MQLRANYSCIHLIVTFREMYALCQCAFSAVSVSGETGAYFLALFRWVITVTKKSEGAEPAA